MLTPEVLLVNAHLQVEGQKWSAEVRSRFVTIISLRVLQRQPDGNRWAAEILRNLVLATTGGTRRHGTFRPMHDEQMGYQAEGPQWRGIFLTAARELRDGVIPAAFATASEDTILAMPIDILFDFVARAHHRKQGCRRRSADRLCFTDLDETWTMWVRRGEINAEREVRDNQLTRVGPKAASSGLPCNRALQTSSPGTGAITLNWR